MGKGGMNIGELDISLKNENYDDVSIRNYCTNQNNQQTNFIFVANHCTNQNN